MIGSYHCPACEVSGQDPEDDEGVVRCWSCGQPVKVYARFGAGVLVQMLQARQQAR